MSNYETLKICPPQNLVAERNLVTADLNHKWKPFCPARFQQVPSSFYAYNRFTEQFKPRLRVTRGCLLGKRLEVARALAHTTEEADLYELNLRTQVPHCISSHDITWAAHQLLTATMTCTILHQHL